MTRTGPQILEFDDYRIDLVEKTLMRDGRPVALTPKVFDTLAVLVENSGRLLAKNELLQRIWQDRFVEEGNLAFNIKEIRKSLGDSVAAPRFIETVPRRGYRFIAVVRPVDTFDQAARSGDAPAEPNADSPNFPDEAPTVGQVVSIANWRTGSALAEATEKVLPPADEPSTARLELVPSISAGRRPRARFAFVASIFVVLGLMLAVAAVYRWSVADGPTNRGSSVTRLTTNGRTKAAAVSPDGKFAAYIREDEGAQSIRLKNIATGADLEILPPAERAALGNLFFTPDGNRIYYTNAGVLFRLSILGDTPQMIRPTGTNGVALSADGSRLAFIRYAGSTGEAAEMVVADADGGGERVLASSRRPEIFLRAPAFAPDGKKIACAALDADGSQKVVVIDAESGAVEPLPNLGWEIVYQIVWRPDSRGMFVLATKGDDFFTMGIRALSYPGGAVSDVTRDGENYQSISLTADGRNLVAVRLEQTAHVWVAPAANPDRAKQLTDGFDKFDGIYGLDWTSDGRIVFETATNGKNTVLSVDEDGRGEKVLAADVFGTVAAVDGEFVVGQGKTGDGFGLIRHNSRDGTRLLLTNGSDIWPAISPEKKWIVFTRYGDDGVALWKVPAEGGAAVRLTYGGGYPLAPSISPDGRRVAYYRTANNAGKPQVAIVSIDGGDIEQAFEVPEQAPQNFWRTVLRWTPDGRALDFPVLREGVSNIWRQPLDGGAAVKVTNFSDQRIFNFAYSPDGQRLVLSRGTFKRDAVLIETTK
jgi:Tol biopolymer transport system component/DNA-binding winged helix-turn-helix (wHTH) protein